MTTTIRVSTDLRDRLKRQAAASQRTLGAQLEYLAELGERQTRFDQLRAAIATTPPAQLASYREETRVWDRIESA